MRVHRIRMIFTFIALAVLLLAAAACEEDPAQTGAPDTAQTEVATLEPGSTSQAIASAAPTTAPNTTPVAGAVTPTQAPEIGATDEPAVTDTPIQETTIPLAPTNANPTVNPAVSTPVPGGVLHVVSTSTYTDTSGTFHVVGEIQNGDTNILTNMQLTVVIKDSGGNSLLRDNNGDAVGSLTFNPMLANLAPGEVAPFDYYLEAGAGTPDPNNVSVSVTGQNTSSITRAAYEIRNAQLKAGGLDSFFVTGEIANKTDRPIAIRGLAVGLVDKDNKVITTDFSSDYAYYLQAAGDQDHRDVTPFYLRLNNPGVAPANWKTYVDALVVDPPANYAVLIKITNNFFDDAGNFHIVGTVTNNGSQALTTQIVAGLYDKNGGVLDAYSSSIPAILAASEERPYDISTFSNVNGNPAEANRVDRFTVQVDNYFTRPSSIETVVLQPSAETIDKVNNQWTVTGKVVNNSNKALAAEIVMMSVYDLDDKLVAYNYGWITPSGDSIAAGDSNSYALVAILDPNANTANYTYKVTVQGEVK